MSNRSKRTPRARKAFLQVLSERCNVTAAAAKAGISTTMAYEWRDSDTDFASAWEEAEEAGAYALHDIAWQRAVGVERDVFDADGNKTGVRVECSDRLMENLLRAHMPGKFRNDGIIAGGIVFAGLVVIGPGGETPGNGVAGDGARDITPSARKLNGGEGNGED